MAFEIDYILLDIGNSSFDVLFKDKAYKFDKVEDIRKFLTSIDFKRSYVSSVNSSFFWGNWRSFKRNHRSRFIR